IEARCESKAGKEEHAQGRNESIETNEANINQEDEGARSERPSCATAQRSSRSQEGGEKTRGYERAEEFHPGIARTHCTQTQRRTYQKNHAKTLGRPG